MCSTAPCSDNLLVLTCEEKLLLTIAAMMSFPCYFGQKDAFECVSVREKLREWVHAWTYMQLIHYLVFLLRFPMLYLAFKEISYTPVFFLSSLEAQSYFHQQVCPTRHLSLFALQNPWPSPCEHVHLYDASLAGKILFFLQTIKYKQQRAMKFTSLNMAPSSWNHLAPCSMWHFLHLPASLEAIFSTCLSPALSLLVHTASGHQGKGFTCPLQWGTKWLLHPPNHCCCQENLLPVTSCRWSWKQQQSLRTGPVHKMLTWHCRPGK